MDAGYVGLLVAVVILVLMNIANGRERRRLHEQQMRVLDILKMFVDNAKDGLDMPTKLMVLMILDAMRD